MSKESIDTLVSELTHEEEWRRMRATAACLAGGPRAVHALTQALQTGDVPLRVEAAAMLSRIKDPAAGVALVELIRDPEETVRQAAFTALEQMAGNLDDDTAAGLVRNLHESPDEDVRHRVRQLLGVIPNAITPLCDMLKHPDEDAQTTAATILEHLLDPRSADGLIDAMASPAVREIAVRTLKKLSAVRDRIDATFHALRDVEGGAGKSAETAKPEAAKIAPKATDQPEARASAPAEPRGDKPAARKIESKGTTPARLLPARI